jgi:hypothetical protein
MRQVAAAILLAGALMAQSAAAGPKDAEIEALVDKAVAETSVAASCSALSEKYFDATLEFWEQSRKDSVMPALVKLGVAPEVFVRLIQKTAPENLILKTKGTTGELIAYCRENQDLFRKVSGLGGVNLRVELEKMLKQ